ncbi:DNA polymerase III subunit delta [Candidatus Falkowbacteria bacterium]|nr:DNA polymerase III subunit delta [Candidatus Falkowbacteria bacterium]
MAGEVLPLQLSDKNTKRMLFSEIIGQEQIKEKLIGTVATNRVAHAQLFYGNNGYGKLALALAYAQFISCRDTDKFRHRDSCGKCPSCIKYNKLIHPDLHFVYPVASSTRMKDSKNPTSNQVLKEWRQLLERKNYYITLDDWYHEIDIDQKQASINTRDCSKIIQTLSYTSYESEYKVMIIWMVEKLYHAAAPRLLKILEEPPEKTLFLLIAEQTDQILSTILSRLHLVKIPAIENQPIYDACRQRLNMSEATAAEAARLANGSFTQAVALLEMGDELSENFRRFRDWMRLCYSMDVVALLKISEEMGKETREKLKNFLRSGLIILRNCLLIGFDMGNLVRVTREEQDFYTRFSPFVHQGNISQFVDEFDKAIYHIERNVHAGMIMLDLSLTVLKLLRVKRPQPTSQE